jgi:hypothetical protein
MSLQVVFVSQDPVLQPGSHRFPGSRADAIDIARISADESCSEVHILLCELLGDLDYEVELARIEVARGSDGFWRLQYVSHPDESAQLTAHVWPAHDDINWRASTDAATYVADVFSSDEMAAEALRPCARLDLRPSTGFPIVPSAADADLLRRACGLDARINTAPIYRTSSQKRWSGDSTTSSN